MIGTGQLRRLRVAACGLLLSAIVLGLGATSAFATTYDTVGVAASSNNVAIGSNLTYMVSIGPGGGTPAVMTDQVNGMTNLTVNTTSGSCTQSAGLVTCQTSLSQPTTVTISGTVTAPAGTLLRDVAIVTPQTGQPVMSATSEADVQVVGGTVPPGPGSGTPDLVTSIVAPSSVPAGGSLTYTLVVGNQGTGNANGVPVVETLPATLTSPSLGSTTSLFGCSISGNTVSCSGGRIDAGAVATITVTGIAPSSGPLVDQAVVDPFDTITESNYNNNNSQATTTVAPNPAANSLSVGLVASPSPDVAQGSTLTYTTTITNTQPAGGASISDIAFMLPTQGLDPSSLQISFVLPTGQSQNVSQACGVSGGTVLCFSADNDSNEVNLAPGGGAGSTMTITVKGTVVAAPAAKIFGSATVVGGQSNPNSNSVSTTATTTTQVKPAIDLSLTKTSLPGTVQAAAPLTYQYVVGNSGLSTALGVVVRDPLPAAMQPPTHGGPYTFVGTDPSFLCSVDANNVLTCTGGVVPAQGKAIIDIQMAAPEATGSYTSVAQVDPNNTIPESDKNNNSATATTTVTPGADFAISQAVDNNPVVTAGSLTYTLTVKNLGTQDTTGVLVTDSLPTGTTYRSATGDHNFTCSAQNGTVTCGGGILNGTYTTGGPPDTATIKILVFAPSSPGNITNLAQVNPGNVIPESDAPNDTNDTSVLTTMVTNDTCPSGPSGCGNYIDLSIPTLTSKPDPVVPNGTVQYVMTVENTGSEQAFQVQVNDTLPAGARFRSATGTNGFTCSASGQVVQCVGGEIDGGGATQTITINAFAPPDPGSYTDLAIVDPNNAIPEANESNNSNQVTTNVATAGGGGTGAYVDLALTGDPATADWADTGQTQVLPSGHITYTLHVSNKGSEQATGVEVDNTIPSNTNFVSANASGGGFSCTQASSPAGTVKCVNGTVVPGSPLTITIVVQAPNLSGAPIPSDTAVVNPGDGIPESDYTNNSASITSPSTLSPIDLSITQDGPGNASQNSTQDYKLTVKNTASGGTAGASAFGVQVHDPLPPGLIVENITSDPNTFSCQVSENPVNVIDCTGDRLDPGQSVTIDVNVFVTAADSTTFTNEACVNPNHTIVESDYTNNCSTVVTAANTPDLAISESAATSPISAGQNEDYSISVNNTGSGPITAGNVTVTDTLPTGLNYVQYTATNGFTCTNSSNTVTCHNGNDMAAGDSTTIKLTASVTSAATGPFTNTATVTGSPTCISAGNPVGCIQTDSDDTATAKVNLNGTGIDLVAQSLKANPDPVQQGQVLTYTGVVSNNGVADSGTFHITQTLPDTGLWDTSKIQTAGSSGFVCNYDSPSNSVICSGDLPAGKSTTITTQILINAGATTGPVTSVLTANSQPSDNVVESDYTNNKQTTVSTIAVAPCSSACVQLVGSQLTGSPEPVQPGGTLLYTYAVGNAGSLPAHHVLILIQLDTTGFDVNNITSATATGGFTCVSGLDAYTNNWTAACFDPNHGCTYTLGTSMTPGSFNCSGSNTSTIAGKSGVTVSINATVSGSAGDEDVIKSTANVSQDASDNNFGGEPSATSNIDVEQDGLLPAGRGSLHHTTGASCHRAKAGRASKKAKGKKHKLVSCTKKPSKPKRKSGKARRH